MCVTNIWSNRKKLDRPENYAILYIYKKKWQHWTQFERGNSRISVNFVTVQIVTK